MFPLDEAGAMKVSDQGNSLMMIRRKVGQKGSISCSRGYCSEAQRMRLYQLFLAYLFQMSFFMMALTHLFRRPFFNNWNGYTK